MESEDGSDLINHEGRDVETDLDDLHLALNDVSRRGIRQLSGKYRFKSLPPKPSILIRWSVGYVLLFLIHVWLMIVFVYHMMGGFHDLLPDLRYSFVELIIGIFFLMAWFIQCVLLMVCFGWRLKSKPIAVSVLSVIAMGIAAIGWLLINYYLYQFDRMMAMIEKRSLMMSVYSIDSHSGYLFMGILTLLVGASLSFYWIGLKSMEIGEDLVQRGMQYIGQATAWGLMLSLAGASIAFVVLSIDDFIVYRGTIIGVVFGFLIIGVAGLSYCMMYVLWVIGAWRCFAVWRHHDAIVAKLSLRRETIFTLENRQEELIEAQALHQDTANI